MGSNRRPPSTSDSGAGAGEPEEAAGGSPHGSTSGTERSKNAGEHGAHRPRHPHQQPGRVPLILAGPRGFSRGIEIDWAKWARHIEARRRKIPTLPALPIAGSRLSYATATFTSFSLEGLDVSREDIDAALTTGSLRRSFRARQFQRVRNHVAILRFLDRGLRRGDPLRPHAVVRWYTSVSCGLSTMQLTGAANDRLVGIVERMNSPELRLQAGIQQVAKLHAQLLADPIVPSFNGILARLLLRYHLGRCGLPPVQFHPQTPVQAMTNANVLLPLLLELLEESYEELLRAAP